MYRKRSLGNHGKCVCLKINSRIPGVFLFKKIFQGRRPSTSYELDRFFYNTRDLCTGGAKLVHSYAAKSEAKCSIVESPNSHRAESGPTPTKLDLRACVAKLTTSPSYRGRVNKGPGCENYMAMTKRQGIVAVLLPGSRVQCPAQGSGCPVLT